MAGRRKLKLQVRVSPKKPTSKVPKKSKRTGTGVQGAMSAESYPQSTNVSSPIQAASKRRMKAMATHDDDDDGFVVSDDHEDSDSDGFAPVREARNRPSFGQRQATLKLGPPITEDQRLVKAKIGELHKDFIRGFLEDATHLDEQLRNDMGRRKALFTQSIYREMAINWTTTLEDMRGIPGIDQADVNRFGKNFIPLVKEYSGRYEEIMSGQEERDMDKNHQVVIEIPSDAESEGFEEQNGEASHYFLPPDVVAFNQKCSQLQSFAPAPEQSKKGEGSKPRDKGNFRKRRSSNAPKRARSDAGVQKTRPAKATSSSKSHGKNIMERFSRKPGRGGGGGGIGMMPT
jgi:bloom syndrome protein